MRSCACDAATFHLWPASHRTAGRSRGSPRVDGRAPGGEGVEVRGTRPVRGGVEERKGWVSLSFGACCPGLRTGSRRSCRTSGAVDRLGIYTAGMGGGGPAWLGGDETSLLALPPGYQGFGTRRGRGRSQQGQGRLGIFSLRSGPAARCKAAAGSTIWLKDRAEKGFRPVAREGRAEPGWGHLTQPRRPALPK